MQPIKLTERLTTHPAQTKTPKAKAGKRLIPKTSSKPSKTSSSPISDRVWKLSSQVRTFPRPPPPVQHQLRDHIEFNEVQADKRNTYRKKVAADKGAGKSEPGEGEGEDGDTTLEHDADGIDREGEPVAKKARREAGDGDVVGEEEGDGEREDEEDEEANGNGDETEEEEGEQEGAERPDDEERPDEEEDEADEALDNGEDSD